MDYHLEVWQQDAGRWGWQVTAGTRRGFGSSPDRATAWANAFRVRMLYRLADSIAVPRG